MELTLSVPFGYEPNDEIRKMLLDFRDMVNFCIEKAIERNATSYAKLRKLIYEEWKKRWDYSTHFCHSACRVATSMFKSFRRLRRKGLAKGDRPVAKKLFMQLDPQLVKFEGGKVRISVKSRKFLYIQLKYGEYQKRFIDEWKAGKLRIGEISINETKVLVPFRKDVDLSNPDDWIAIDINESNVTGASTNPHVVRFETNLREIRSVYFEKRRRIQKLAKYKPITSKRLMVKYSEREENRVKDLYHKVSKAVVGFTKRNGFGIVMEDLKHMRKRIHCYKRMNRRLHTLPFRKLQSYIEYKAHLTGLPTIYIDPKHTSSLCPICGEKLASNGYRLMKCKKCWYENDRDITACLNLLKRAQDVGLIRSPRKPSMNEEGEGLALRKLTLSQNGRTPLEIFL